ncbi:ABC transporter permease [Anaeromyxobacter diazotrophicus]|uniref:ABC transporter ATP-binding protein n=1 Tax=Anaeromyxobacter diazotrophicus TaxID=2590199 RepID=A0A7I9VM65_9BACT|nr:ABC transporter permease [Anaeromyxobacter diazotrophicus]GEJ57491.1 ABC transporter ATP-binding protein [Anaeromyxobacter diazotrophicus]
MTRLRQALARGWAELDEAVRIALGTLAAHRLRSFLTTLGIVIGVTTVIAIIAIIQGIDASFEAQVANLGTNTVYVSKWKWLDLNDEWYLLRNRKSLTLTEWRAVERESRLAVATSPRIWQSTQVSHGTAQLSRVDVFGVGPRYLEVAGGTVAAGRFLTETDVDLDRPAAVLGAEVADVLFPRVAPADVLGQRVVVGGHPLTVVGVLARKGRFLDLDMDKQLCMPIGTFRNLLGVKRSLTIAVTAPPGRLDALEDELTGILRRVRAVPAGKPDDFTVNRQDQFLKVYASLTAALYGVAVAVGLITLVVGGIGIMNIMMVSVHERTREIGLRRALGARRRTILFQFMLEASLVAALGGSVGTALGLGAAQLIALTTPLAAAVAPSAVALGLGFSATVGILFGSWPAWRAAHLDPVEALRWE